MEIIKRCKACGSPLDAQGICSKPCKLGKLQKQIAELKAKVAKEKEINTKEGLDVINL